MKFLYSLLFVFSTTNFLFGQDCKVLDKKSFFKSIKFGNPIPEDLFVCSKVQKNAFFRMDYNSTDGQCRNKYADLFGFLSNTYTFLQIGQNQKGQIYSVDLYSFFDDIRDDTSKQYDPPANFMNTYNHLISLYGMPTRIENANERDSLFIKESGIPKMAAWECNRISLTLRIRYGARNTDLNIFYVGIVDMNYLDVPTPDVIKQ